MLGEGSPERTTKYWAPKVGGSIVLERPEGTSAKRIGCPNSAEKGRQAVTRGMLVSVTAARLRYRGSADGGQAARIAQPDPALSRIPACLARPHDSSSSRKQRRVHIRSDAAPGTRLTPNRCAASRCHPRSENREVGVQPVSRSPQPMSGAAGAYA